MQYVTSHLRFADGTTVAYDGSANDVKQPLIGVTVVSWANIILNSMISDQLLQIGVVVATSIAGAYVYFPLIQAIAPHVTTNNGNRLNFLPEVWKNI